MGALGDILGSGSEFHHGHAFGDEWLRIGAVKAFADGSLGSRTAYFFDDFTDEPLYAWVTGFGRVMGCPDARIVALSEHHGTIDWPVDAELPALGQTLALIPNHVCVTMNLVDEVTVVDGDAVVDRWRVAARGRNR